MPPLQTFFSRDCGVAFSSALPGLRNELARAPFAAHSKDFGVAGNTFRAYQGLPVQPSAVYRAWASAVCHSLAPQALAVQLSTPQGFKDWHDSLAASLLTSWEARQGRSLSFAHKFKLVDLFIKWLSSYDFGSPALTNALVSHANCALDSQTLGKLNQCLSLALPITKPRMGDIHSRETYDFCQALITDFAVHWGGTRLLFDYFAWRPGGGA